MTESGACHILGVPEDRNGRGAMAISDELRAAVAAEDATYYRIAKDAKVDWGTLQRFVDGRRPNIRIDTADKLCEHLGLELRPKPKVRRSK